MQHKARGENNFRVCAQQTIVGFLRAQKITREFENQNKQEPRT